MKLCEYLHFNDVCPICGKNLTLYLCASKSAVWKGTPVGENEDYHFERGLLKEDEYTGEDTFEMRMISDGIQFTFNSDELIQEAKTWQFFLFKICDPGGLEGNKWDYEVNAYRACYYRSSAWHQFSPDNYSTVEIVDPDHASMLNRDESMIFKIQAAETVEKVYALSLDHEHKCTKLWYYTTTAEQREMEKFEPNIFEKIDLPLLPARPDLDIENRQKLISRLDSWILLS